MRGHDIQQADWFSYKTLEERVPEGHPLRLVRLLTNAVLETMDGEFEKLYSRTGRPSIPPERLLRASLLQIFYTVRSERQLMGQLDFNLLFRWFVGLNMDAGVWDPLDLFPEPGTPAGRGGDAGLFWPGGGGRGRLRLGVRRTFQR